MSSNKYTCPSYPISAEHVAFPMSEYPPQSMNSRSCFYTCTCGCKLLGGNKRENNRKRSCKFIAIQSLRKRRRKGKAGPSPVHNYTASTLHISVQLLLFRRLQCNSSSTHIARKWKGDNTHACSPQWRRARAPTQHAGIDHGCAPDPSTKDCFALHTPT